MDKPVNSPPPDLPSFWGRFFESRGWTHRTLARRLEVRDDVISHWVNGDTGIGPKNVQALLSQDLLSPQEKLDFSRLYLGSLGFTPDVIDVLSQAIPGARAHPSGRFSINNRHKGGACRTLVLSPLVGVSGLFYLELFSSIARRAQLLNHEILLKPISSPSNVRSLSSFVENIHQVDCVIAITCQVKNTGWLSECTEMGIPIVLVHDNIELSDLQGTSVVSYIWPDLTAVTALVTHLIQEHGCRHFRVLMVDPRGHRLRETKLSLIKSTVQEYGLEFVEAEHLFTLAEYSHREGVRAAQLILEIGDPVDALICLDDVVALGAWTVVRRYGRGDIRVTGFDNLQVAEDFDLTTVDQQLGLTGEHAILDLGTAMNGRISGLSRPTLIPTLLRRRASCCSLGFSAIDSSDRR